VKGIFVTGTDTDVGKTVVSAILTQGFSSEGASYAKPIQTGAVGKVNGDTGSVEKWTGSSFLEPVYDLQEPASPDRAAKKEGLEIDLSVIHSELSKIESPFLVVEGAGGCRVPINPKNDTMDMMALLGLPVAVVASTRLGTINHTCLTWETLKLRGLDPKVLFLVGPEDEGLATLFKQQLGVEFVVEVPWFPEVSKEAIDDFIKTSKTWAHFKNNFFRDMEDTDWSTLDLQKVWHPFTQHGWGERHPIILKGRGTELTTQEGNILLDGISSWWTNIHGHGHKEMAAAISRQAHRLEHVIFSGFSHRPGIAVIDNMTKACADRGCHLTRGFYSDNGSTAVEVALKMAYQFFQNRGEPSRKRFLVLKNSYHGDTLGAMSVGDRGTFHQAFNPLLFDVDAVEPDNFEELESLFKDRGSEYCAVIVEPLVQGAGGMKFYSSQFLDRLQELASEYGVLKIADEIFTGFFRTGTLFTFEQSQFRPEILCVSKGLTGGYLPLSLTLCGDDIFNAFKSDKMGDAFLHGHSYTGNPLGCAAALKSWEILWRKETQSRIQEISQKMTNELEKLTENFPITNPRQKGPLVAFEVGGGKGYFSTDFSRSFRKLALEKGLLLRPLGDTVYALPPYCITDQEIKRLFQGIFEILAQLKLVN